jgi:hypothetical protein
MWSVMIDFFEQANWDCDLTIDGDEKTIAANYEQPDVGAWDCYAVAREPQQQCLFYSQCPIAIQSDRWVAVAEFLTRANYGIPIGNFEINLDTGDIRFKTGIDIEDDRLSTALFKGIVQANLAMMAKYLPGIVQVGLEEISATAAIGALEEGAL